MATPATKHKFRAAVFTALQLGFCFAILSHSSASQLNDAFRSPWCVGVFVVLIPLSAFIGLAAGSPVAALETLLLVASTRGLDYVVSHQAPLLLQTCVALFIVFWMSFVSCALLRLPWSAWRNLSFVEGYKALRPQRA